jgi:hypothetical protein
VAIALSWRHIEVPSRSTVIKTVRVGWAFAPGGRNLTLEFHVENLSNPFHATDVIHVNGTINATLTTLPMHFWLVVDRDLSTLSAIDAFTNEANVSFGFVPIHFPIPEGTHEIGIYGIGTFGDVSWPFYFSVTIAPPRASPWGQRPATSFMEPEEVIWSGAWIMLWVAVGFTGLILIVLTAFCVCRDRYSTSGTF